MKQKTYLKFKEPEDKRPTPLCTTVEGTLLKLPVGYEWKLNPSEAMGFMPEGIYEVYTKPCDSLYAGGEEPLYERCYYLKFKRKD